MSVNISSILIELSKKLSIKRMHKGELHKIDIPELVTIDESHNIVTSLESSVLKDSFRYYTLYVTFSVKE